MDFYYKQEIRLKMEGQHHLHPLFSSVYNIPERLYEYNNALFVCFNSETQRYELHSLEQPVSFAAVLPYKDLDARSLRWIWNNDIRVHGKAIFERIEKSEEQAEKQKKREFHNWAESVAKETQSLFAKDAWA
jgi:hypothetical protein